MIRRLTFLTQIVATNAFGQGNKEYEDFVVESSLPDDLYHFYNKENIKSIYSIRTDLNPFYLRGDFDGDKIQDYALGIVQRKTNKKGILIYHSGTKKHFIIGAGQSLNVKHPGDDFHWMDAWKVYMDKEVEIGVGESEKIHLKGEAILAIKLEAASGLIYWTGREFKWYQQGD